MSHEYWGDVKVRELEEEVARLRSLRDHLLERGEAVARLHAGRLEAKDAEIARLRAQIEALGKGER